MEQFKTLPRHIIFLLGVVISFVAYGQKEVRLYEKAELELQASHYLEALDYYQQISDIDPDFRDVEFKLEVCSLLSTPGDNKPIDRFLAMEETYGETDERYYYWLGKIYVHRYMITKATEAFEKFQQLVAYTGGANQEFVQNLMAHAARLKEYFYNPDDYAIHQLESPVNSPFTELSPVYSKEQNELLFLSDRAESGEKPFKIFYTRSNPDGWKPLTEVENLGAFSRNNANIEVVNEDGRLFLFREEKGGNLYYSQARGTTWSVPVEFDSRVSNNHIASHFFINEHEDRIIFASEQDDAGLDIYESFKDHESGKWSRPSTFYSTVNSQYDEDSPYLSLDEKQLYFCSNRPGGLGGYDVYVSNYDSETFSWSEPENMGWPINSPDNEFHFKMNPDQTSGYFVSDRLHSQGGFDIYFFWHIDKVKIEGRVFDEKSNGPLTNAEIRFRPSQYLDEYFRSEIDQTGTYSTKIISDEIFNVEILVQGKVIHTEKFEIHDSGSEPTTHVKDFTIN